MAITPKESKSRPLLWAFGAAGLIAAALIAKGQFGDHPKKHHAVTEDDESAASTAQPLVERTAQRTATTEGQAAPTVVAREVVPAAANGADPNDYINQRFPVQVTPEVHSLAVDNEAKMRQMFPKYKAAQEKAEADAKEQGLPPPPLPGTP